MEVHHPHEPGHKKKWNEYLLEFFMLFLAVFLGFVAENIREHVVEKNRAKNLTSALIRDLGKDTAELNRLSEFEQRQILRLDSLVSILKMPSDRTPLPDLNRLLRYSQITFGFVQANATINQLKNAGYLRYFSKDSLASLLSEYDFLLKDNEGMDGIVTNLVYDKYYSLLIKTLDPELMLLQFSNKMKIPISIGITPIAKEDLKRILNVLAIIRHSKEVYLIDYSDLKNKAIQIINYLKK